MNGSVFFDDYFTVQRRDYNLSMNWQSGSRYGVNLEYSINDIDLREGRFKVRVAQANLNINFNTQLIMNVTAQHDNISERLGVNARLRWTFAGHHDLFLVLNHASSTRDNRLRALETEAIAKLGLSDFPMQVDGICTNIHI